MASNTAAIADPDYHVYSDWFELHNNNLFPVNLKNYSVTDDFSQPQKFIFQTDVIVPPQGYLVIWCDGKDSGIHTNFKLSASGQQVCLFNPLGELVDSITFFIQQTDISFGRFPDGVSDWYKFSPSSPGTTNLNSSIFNKLSEPLVSQQSGFYDTPITLTITPLETNTVIYYTTDGTTPTNKSSIFTGSIQINSTSVLRIRSFQDGSLGKYVDSANGFQFSTKQNQPVTPTPEPRAIAIQLSKCHSAAFLSPTQYQSWRKSSFM